MQQCVHKTVSCTRSVILLTVAMFFATSIPQVAADNLSSVDLGAGDSSSIAVSGVELVGIIDSQDGAIENASDGLSQSSAPTLPSTAGMSQIEKVFSGGASPEVLRNLKQFGYELFQRETASFNPEQNVSVGPHYVLGIGDEVIIHIWGRIVQQTIPLTVVRDGSISLPKQGPVQVRGLRLSEARDLISKAITLHYANVEVSVTLGRLRTIDVFVLGEINTPGRYELNSLSTILHSLYAAGGPTTMGTLRGIKLMRDGQLVSEIDLYDLLLRGSDKGDVRLSSGDTVFVPRIGPVIGVAGFVKAPAIYETKGAMHLDELFELAGGFTPASYLNRIQIERTSDEGRRVVQDIEIGDLESLGQSDDNLALKDGDLVLVFPINFNRHGYVSVSGNIARPSQYEFTREMRVSDLIARAGGLVKGAHMERANLVRFMDRSARQVLPVDLSAIAAGDTAADLRLQEWDELQIFTESDLQPDRFAKISGAVFKPGDYALKSSTTLADLIFRGGGTTPQAFLENIEIYRRSTGSDQPAEVITVDLIGSEAQQNEQGRSGDWLLPLRDGDHVFIRSQKSTAEKQVVEMRGEVMFPGPYVIRPDDTLGKLITRAGGLTDVAFLPGLHFSRATVRDRQKKQLERIFKLQNEALLRAQVAYHEVESRSGNIRSGSDGENELRFRQQLLQLIGEAKPAGRVLLQIDDDLEDFTGSASDPRLLDGDVIRIPPIPETVAVVGAVTQPQDMLFESRERVEHYTEQCGGLANHADGRGVYVVRANGRVDKGRKQYVARGDTIVVPEKHSIRRYRGGVAADIITSLYQLTIGIAVLDDLL